MPLYMVQFAYTSDAWAALVDTQEDRSVAIASVAATMGSRMVCYYLTFGEYDFLTIIEAPGETQMAAILLSAAGAGGITDVRTTIALSAVEAKGAFAAAGDLSHSFRTPGGA